MRYFELTENDEFLNISRSVFVSENDYIFVNSYGDVCISSDFNFDSLDSQLFLYDRIDHWFPADPQSKIDSLTDEDLHKQELINIDFNSIKRVYPDGTIKRCVSDRPFNVAGRNEFPAEYDGTRSVLYRRRRSSERIQDPNADKSSKSLDRARKMVFDIAMLNQWDWFITLTFSPDLIERTDFKSVSQRLYQWINDHLVKKFDNVKYLAVAEQHKKYEKNGKRAYHYHMLLSGVPDDIFIDSGTCLIKGWNKPIKYDTFYKLKKLGTVKDSDFKCSVFNVSTFRSGFSTAIRVYQNGLGLASYFTKYIAKDLDSTDLPFGKAVYKCSRGNLVKEPDIYYGSFDVRKVPSYALEVAKDYGHYYFWDNIAERTKDQLEFFVFGIHPRLIAGLRSSTPGKG